MKIITSFLIILLLTVSCDTYNQDTYQELIVIEGYIVAGRDLPEIRVSSTMPVDMEYRFSEAALNSANIQIVLLNENNEATEVFEYIPDSEIPGVYRAIASPHIALPGRTYRLDLDFDNRQEVLTATTTVPDQVQIANAVKDTVVYQSDDQLEILLSPTQKTQNQNIFVFDSIARHPTLENLTPFYRSAVLDGDAEIGDFIKNSSGLINEGNFEINPDGTILLKFPWIGVAFYEENQVVTNSVDRNLADLIRSQEVQLGGSTLSPGEIPNLVYNIDGGIGIFGSISSDTVQTYFRRP
jgi:hypothetical protein